jgi:hypothetical protein
LNAGDELVLYLLKQIFTITKLHQGVLEGLTDYPSEQARDTERLQQIAKGIEELDAMFRDAEPPAEEEESH